MEIIIAAFIAGVAVGLFIYWFEVIQILGRFPFSKCDYCQFRIKKEELFPHKSKRK